MQTTMQGRRVGYDGAGQGTSVVLIHGFPLNRTMWAPQIEELGKSAHVIAPDLRGFGDSEAGEGETTMATYAEDLNLLLQELGIARPVVLCGLSMGGYVAFEFYRRYSQQVAAVIFANTKAGPDTPEGRAGRDKSAALAKEKGAPAIADAMLPKMFAPKTYQANSELVERLKRLMSSAAVPGIVGALKAMRDRPDSTSTARTIECPSLVITGADDQLIPPSEADSLAHALPNARLVILPDAGHLSNLEQPAAFTRAVREFLHGLG